MTSSEIYLEFLRAGLWNRPAVVSGTANIGELIKCANRQTTAPLVYKAFLDRCAERIPPKTRDLMEETVARCARSHDAANTVIAAVVGLLSREGISTVLLKGQGVAAHYPVPNLRQAGDIDLYVSDYERACAILERQFGAKDGESDKHASYHVGGTLEIELHRYTEVLPGRRDNEFYASISDEGTSKDLVPVDLGGDEVMTPADTFNAFYIFHHLWNHLRSMGIGMRQLCDLAVILRSRKDSIDTQRLGTWLRKLRLLDVWQVFGCAVVLALGLEPSEVPFYDASKEARARKLVDYILNQGNNIEFKHGRSKETALKKKTGSLRYIHRRLGLMFPIFPSYALLQYVGDIKNGILKFFKAGPSDIGA